MVDTAGLQRWRENLQLLVPFLIEPRIVLFSLTELSDLADSDASKRLKVRAFPDSVHHQLPALPTHETVRNPVCVHNFYARL